MANNIKKPMNSLFLDFLINSQSRIDTNAEKWLESNSILDNIDEISDAVNEHLVLLMACWGEIGWCLPKCKERDVYLGKVLEDLKNNISINEIDKGLSECFKECEIEAFTIIIKKSLSVSDTKKLEVAFELYLKQEYFTSAVILAGIIDSISINQFIKANTNSENPSQCWKCYGKVIQDSFGGKYFSGVFPYKAHAKDDKRAKDTIEFFKSIKHDVFNHNVDDILVPLSFALLKFYDDSNWFDKQQGYIPSSINRHWLAHSMYDYNDISRADCIKLFCMLYQMIELYSTI